MENNDAREMALQARASSRAMQSVSSSEKAAALHRVADALVANEAEILAANSEDIAEAERTGVEKALLSRLKLKPGKIEQLAQGVRMLANMEEPVGRVLRRTQVAEGLMLEQVTSPLGVLLIIFESRPDALPQIASLAISSGNGLLLKGGKEASRSNAILHKTITEALAPTINPNLVGLVTSREGVADLLKLNDVIDLVIPRGSNALVSHIQNNTKIPVMGHADGVCHVFVDADSDFEKVKNIVVDSKVDYPAACNAMETVLVHEALSEDGRLKELLKALTDAGVVRCFRNLAFF
ncbi:Delta-1-pyrroline-5-carboxylate synthase [Cymbomonas tetramitiformis]|uniref:Delta-1-pyrroline-5-carboxylate synthase n=1 Tax=Cymbomonas tetramitiformis TaxID=36881 RepID=A0AAE0C0T8_9CHLO|nr:Delta-1-pyrroline-5-carboxylate synthase [Cymbomonas tetramitiformis]